MLKTEQVKEAIRRKIKAGIFPKGSRIPPERVLLKESNFSRITIRRALSNLVEEGILIRKNAGRGLYVNPDYNSNKNNLFWSIVCLF